jgi:hypothetical protein
MKVVRQIDYIGCLMFILGCDRGFSEYEAGISMDLYIGRVRT